MIFKNKYLERALKGLLFKMSHTFTYNIETTTDNCVYCTLNRFCEKLYKLNIRVMNDYRGKSSLICKYFIVFFVVFDFEVYSSAEDVSSALDRPQQLEDKWSAFLSFIHSSLLFLSFIPQLNSQFIRLFSSSIIMYRHFLASSKSILSYFLRFYLSFRCIPITQFET